MSFSSIAGNISFLQLTHYSHSGRRFSVPVKPSQTVFAQYRHISGIPAFSGQATVPLSRIQLLNNLIGSLQKVKNDSGVTPVLSGISPEKADALMNQYASELHQQIVSAPVTSGASGFGMVFSVSA